MQNIPKPFQPPSPEQMRKNQLDRQNAIPKPSEMAIQQNTKKIIQPEKIYKYKFYEEVAKDFSPVQVNATELLDFTRNENTRNERKLDTLNIELNNIKYTISKDDFLGQGASADVYKAINIEDENAEPIAIKIIKLSEKLQNFYNATKFKTTSLDDQSQPPRIGYNPDGETQNRINGLMNELHILSSIKKSDLTDAMKVHNVSFINIDTSQEDPEKMANLITEFVKPTDNSKQPELVQPDIAIMAVEFLGETLETSLEKKITELKDKYGFKTTEYNIAVQKQIIPELLETIKKAATSITNLHDAGFIHNDLKKDNIMENGRLIDHNISQIEFVPLPDSFFKDELPTLIKEQPDNTLYIQALALYNSGETRAAQVLLYGEGKEVDKSGSLRYMDPLKHLDSSFEILIQLKDKHPSLSKFGTDPMTIFSHEASLMHKSSDSFALSMIIFDLLPEVYGFKNIPDFIIDAGNGRKQINPLTNEIITLLNQFKLKAIDEQGNELPAFPKALTNGLLVGNLNDEKNRLFGQQAQEDRGTINEISKESIKYISSYTHEDIIYLDEQFKNLEENLKNS